MVRFPWCWWISPDDVSKSIHTKQLQNNTRHEPWHMSSEGVSKCTSTVGHIIPSTPTPLPTNPENTFSCLHWLVELNYVFSIVFLKKQYLKNTQACHSRDIIMTTLFKLQELGLMWRSWVLDLRFYMCNQWVMKIDEKVYRSPFLSTKRSYATSM